MAPVPYRGSGAIALPTDPPKRAGEIEPNRHFDFISVQPPCTTLFSEENSS